MSNRCIQFFVLFSLLQLSSTAFAQMTARDKNIVKMLCVLDGEIIYDPDSSMTVQTLTQLDPHNLGFTTQIKPDKALKLYGNKGRNGVFLMYTKNDPAALSADLDFLRIHVKDFGADPYVQLKSLHRGDSIVDGTHLKKGQALPEYPGGNQALQKFISDGLKYPQLAKENYVMGKVMIGFIVNETGIASDMAIVYGKNLGGGLGDEAMSLCKGLSKFYPGTTNSIPDKTFYFIPITFQLPLPDDSN